MGRRKRNRHRWQMTRQRQSLEVVRTDEEMEEDAFFLLVDESGFTLPHVFRDWKKYFVSRTSFLEEACRWIKAEFDGMSVRVITDVECGRGSYNSNRIRNGQVSPEDRILYEGEHHDVEEFGWSEDYEWVNPPQRQGPKWVKGQGYTFPKNYWENGTLFSKELPLEPVISAPEGISGKNLVVL